MGMLALNDPLGLLVDDGEDPRIAWRCRNGGEYLFSPGSRSPPAAPVRRRPLPGFSNPTARTRRPPTRLRACGSPPPAGCRCPRRSCSTSPTSPSWRSRQDACRGHPGPGALGRRLPGHCHETTTVYEPNKSKVGDLKIFAAELVRRVGGAADKNTPADQLSLLNLRLDVGAYCRGIDWLSAPSRCRTGLGPVSRAAVRRLAWSGGGACNWPGAASWRWDRNRRGNVRCAGVRGARCEARVRRT